MQAPAEFLQPQQETTIQSEEFTLHYRSLEIRFHIDKTRFSTIKNIQMKCIAKIERFPRLTREKSYRLYIASTDDLTNQKLVNWKHSSSTGKCFAKTNSRGGRR